MYPMAGSAYQHGDIRRAASSAKRVASISRCRVAAILIGQDSEEIAAQRIFQPLARFKERSGVSRIAGGDHVDRVEKHNAPRPMTHGAGDESEM